MAEASIKDVAKLAGVGIGTVSRALNGNGYVAEKTKNKILEAAKALRYIPNERARSLSKKRSGIIGVIIPNFESPYYGRLIKYIEIELHRHGYRTMICNTIETSDREKEYVDLLEQNAVDGIITCALSLEEEVYKSIQKPIVSMDHDLGASIPLINSNHKMGGQMAAHKFLEADCKCVVQIGGMFNTNTPSNDRYLELERIMNDHGKEVITIDAAWNNLDYNYYLKVTEQHFDIIKKADGIFASDLGAVALYNISAARGIKIPEELKIIAYDGLDITRMMAPFMTAIVQDVEMLAELCVETMLKLINGDKDVPCHQVVDVMLQKGNTA